MGRRSMEGLAAVAAGLVVGVWLPEAVRAAGFGWGFPRSGIGAVAVRADILRFAPAAVALAVLAVPLVAGTVRWVSGWAVAATGSLIVLALFVADRPRTVAAGATEQLVITTAAGLVLGGVVVALCAGPPATRWFIAAGFALGFSLAPEVTGYVITGRGDDVGPYRWVAGTAMVLAVVAAIVARDRTREPHPVRGLVAPLLVVAGLAAVALVADIVRENVFDAVLTTPTPRREQGAVQADRYTRLVGGAGIAVLLVWYGYARGRAEVARWICAGFGLGLILAVNPVLVFLRRPNEPRLLDIVVVLAVALGVVLTRFAGRWFPWDALALFAGAVGLVLAVPPVAAAIWTPDQPSFLVAAASGAFLLAAGLTLATSWRSAPPVAAANVALGFAAALLAGGQIVPVLTRQMAIQRLGEGVPLDGPVLLGLAGLATVVLFAIARGSGTTER